MIDFNLLNDFWYFTFQVYSILACANFVNDLQMSAMLGENLLQ